MESLIEKLNDGGILISYPILILLLVIVFLFIRGITNGHHLQKSKELIAAIGWFVLAWGYLGRTFGLIQAFDRVAAAGDITPELMSGGLKMALVGPFLAWVTFAIARLEIIALILTQKKKPE